MQYCIEPFSKTSFQFIHKKTKNRPHYSKILISQEHDRAFIDVFHCCLHSLIVINSMLLNFPMNYIIYIYIYIANKGKYVNSCSHGSQLFIYFFFMHNPLPSFRKEVISIKKLYIKKITWKKINSLINPLTPIVPILKLEGVVRKTFLCTPHL